jgi:hypothetical protein
MLPLVSARIITGIGRAVLAANFFILYPLFLDEISSDVMAKNS